MNSVAASTLAEQVFDLARAQRGVDGHENRADLRQRELQDDPFGHVGRPHGDAIAAVDAGGDQAARDQPRFGFELAERPAQVAIGIDEGFVVGKRIGQLRQQRPTVTSRNGGGAMIAGFYLSRFLHCAMKLRFNVRFGACLSPRLSSERLDCQESHKPSCCCGPVAGRVRCGHRRRHGWRDAGTRTREDDVGPRNARGSHRRADLCGGMRDLPRGRRHRLAAAASSASASPTATRCLTSPTAPPTRSSRWPTGWRSP